MTGARKRTVGPRGHSLAGRGDRHQMKAVRREPRRLQAGRRHPTPRHRLLNLLPTREEQLRLRDAPVLAVEDRWGRSAPRQGLTRRAVCTPIPRHRPVTC